jgi:hypothetical protein
MLSLCRGKLPVVSALFTTLNWGMVEGGGALTLHNWLEWSQGLCPGLQLELAGGGGGGGGETDETVFGGPGHGSSCLDTSYRVSLNGIRLTIVIA